MDMSDESCRDDSLNWTRQYLCRPTSESKHHGMGCGGYVAKRLGSAIYILFLGIRLTGEVIKIDEITRIDAQKDNLLSILNTMHSYRT